MKFSCDACGAQYMIADEKIGPRGVKVRCKKCANVIILRPGASSPPPAAAPTRASAPPEAVRASRPLASVPPPPPSDEDSDATIALGGGVPSVAPGAAVLASEFVTHDEDHLPPEAVGTSSEFGLSVEFAAAGFDEPTSQFSPRARQQTLSVGLDVARMDSEQASHGPFRGVATGGSLDQLDLRAPSGRNGANGHSAPNGYGLHDDVENEDEDPGLATRVDAHAIPAFNEDDDESREMKTAVGFSPLGASVTAEAGDDEEDEDDADAAAERDAFDDGADVDPGIDRDPPASEMLARAEFEAAFGQREDEDEDQVGLPDDPGEHTARAGGAALAAPAADDDDEPGAVMNRIEPRHLENEIGSAFDSVFDGESGESDPFAALRAEAGSALAESGFADDDENRVATRVFDNAAMQRVQREQDLAHTGDDAPAAAETPEWYVAIDDQQVGPMTVADLQDRWDAKDVDANSLCWKAGMADWIAIRFVKELEGLGSMEAQRTQVAKVESSEDAPEASSSSPGLAIANEPTAAAARRVEVGTQRVATSSSMAALAASAAPSPAAEPLSRGASALAAVAGDPPEPPDPSEPSWRPGAASALASLAAETLSRAPASAGDRSHPRGDGANTALLDDGRAASSDGRAAGSLFGAAELSSSKVMRPLPKASDVASSLPLRDPVSARSRPNPLVAAAIGGLAVLVIVLLLVVFLRPDPQPTLPPGAMAAAGGAALPPSTPTPTPTPTPPPAPAPVPAADPTTPTDMAGTPGEPGAGTAAAAAAPAEPEGSKVEKTEAKAETKVEKTEAKADAKVERTRSKPERSKPRTTRDRDRDRDRGERRREERSPEPEAAPPPPPPPPPSALTKDDLLGGGRSPKPAEEEKKLPASLDDSEILRVLRKHKNDIRDCLAKQAEADPGLDGVMTVKFLIRKNGRTFDHEVSPEKFRGAVVGKCVLGSVRGWRFPEFDGSPLPLDFPVKVRGR